MDIGKLADMVEVFEGLEDWRNVQQTRHRLSELLTVAVCAVLGGADDFEEVPQWGQAKLLWLRGFLRLDYGVASPDTFERVFALIDPQQFERAFRAWVGSIIPALGQDQVVAIDAGLLCFEAQAHPEQYASKPIEMLFYEGGNPVMTGMNPESTIEGLKAIPFVVNITLYVDETALVADLVIPDVSYLERYGWEGMWSVEDEGIQIQQPVIEPLYGIRHGADIYIELANRLGIMTGPLGYSSFLNMMQMTGGATEAVSQVAVNDINHVYRSAKEYVETYVRQMAPDDEEKIWKQGHNLRTKPAYKRYVPDTFGGHRIPLYSYWLKQVGDELRHNMEDKQVFAKVPALDPERLYLEYQPLPFWHESVLASEPADFDLYAINWRTAMSGVGAGTLPATNAWLLEATERDPYFARILLNSATARRKKLSDGQRVCVESPNGRIEGLLKCTETIHPEVVGTIGCWGQLTDASPAKGRGPGHFNSLLGRGLKYMGPTTLQAECAARVKIYPARV